MLLTSKSARVLRTTGTALLHHDDFRTGLPGVCWDEEVRKTERLVGLYQTDCVTDRREDQHYFHFTVQGDLV